MASSSSFWLTRYDAPPIAVPIVSVNASADAVMRWEILWSHQHSNMPRERVIGLWLLKYTRFTLSGRPGL